MDADAPLNGENKEEISTRASEILEEESKREEIIRILKDKIADGIKQDQIHQSSCRVSCFGLPSEQLTLPSKDVQVIEDSFEMYPSFTDILFCSLDNEMLQLYILYFVFFDILWGGQSLLSMFAVYIIQRLIKYWRETKGTDNLCKKTYIDEVFLS